LKEKNQEIENLNNDISNLKNNFQKLKEEKSNEISSLKNEISKYNKEINILVKKNDSLLKVEEDNKKSLYQMQVKLDKKTKELKELNESAKKLIENKDNLIKQYEDKIDEIYTEKNSLISQNLELLDKVKGMNSKGTNLEDLLNEEEENEDQDNNDNNNNNNNNKNDDENDYETSLLKSEIKSLKEQIANQAHDLVELNAMEKEVSRLKSENEKLVDDYKSLKEKMQKQKYEESADQLMSLIKYSNKKQRLSVNLPKFGMKELTLENKKQIQKQKEALDKIKEDEKKNLLDEIDKLKGDIAVWKVKFLNQELDNEVMIVKYKNIIKSINE